MRHIYLISLLILGNFLFGQNLLDTSTWIIGNTTATGFSPYTLNSTNFRILETNHVGDEVVVWEGNEKQGSNGDGGFLSDNHSIDISKTYRYSVWVKKKISHDGKFYFGPFIRDASGNNQAQFLSGAPAYNFHYFYANDLPNIDQWYLVVGYVHPHDYTGTTNLGKVYDGMTTAAITYTTDYKMSPQATISQHRSFVYGSNTVGDKILLWNPRVDIVNGTEPTIEDLMLINPNSKLIVEHDAAFNQNQRFYCNSPNCNPPPPPPSVYSGKNNVVDSDFIVEEEVEEEQLTDFSGSLKIYPNPTDSHVTIELGDIDINELISIELYAMNGQKLIQVSANETLNIDLSNYSTGIYLLNINLSKQRITKRITKL